MGQGTINPTIIIAEAGDNHNGDIGRACQLIDAAVDAGADYVKFQTFQAEAVVLKICRNCLISGVRQESKKRF